MFCHISKDRCERSYPEWVVPRHRHMMLGRGGFCGANVAARLPGDRVTQASTKPARVHPRSDRAESGSYAQDVFSDVVEARDPGGHPFIEVTTDRVENAFAERRQVIGLGENGFPERSRRNPPFGRFGDEENDLFNCFHPCEHTPLAKRHAFAKTPGDTNRAVDISGEPTSPKIAALWQHTNQMVRTVAETHLNIAVVPCEVPAVASLDPHNYRNFIEQRVSTAGASVGKKYGFEYAEHFRRTRWAPDWADGRRSAATGRAVDLAAHRAL